MPDEPDFPDMLKRDEQAENETQYSVWEIALNPAFTPILAACFFLNLSGNASNAVFSLFAYTPAEQGGLSQEVGHLSLHKSHVLLVTIFLFSSHVAR